MPSSASEKWLPLCPSFWSIGPFFFQPRKKPSPHSIFKASVAVLATLVFLFAICPFPLNLLAAQELLLYKTKDHTRKRSYWIYVPLFFKPLRDFRQTFRLVEESILLQADQEVGSRRSPLLLLLGGL